MRGPPARQCFSDRAFCFWATAANGAPVAGVAASVTAADVAVAGVAATSVVGGVVLMHSDETRSTKGAEEKSAPAEKKAKPETDRLGKKILKDMKKRGWTEQELNDAIEKGNQSPSRNLRNGNPATVYVNPQTGKPVVVDDITGEVIQVGERGFNYDHYLK